MSAHLHTHPMLSTTTATAATAASQGFAKIAVATMAGLTATLAALQTEAVKIAAGAAEGQPVIIASDSTLRLWCLTGALLGAILRLCMHPPKNPAGFARSFFACLITGVLFTPMVVRHFDLAPDVDHILFTSGLVAFTAYIGLEGAEALVRKWFKKREGE